MSTQNENSRTESRQAERTRAFGNPAFRVPFPDDFPPLFLTTADACTLKKTVTESLNRCGMDPRRVRKIGVAYPHKHPSDMSHSNSAYAVARDFTQKMNTAYGRELFVPAHAIYDTRKLWRAFEQSSHHALTAGQIYEVDASVQHPPLPFLHKVDPRSRCFVIVDSFVEQGTTLANLYSFLTANGGVVLAAGADDVHGRSSRFLAQQNTPARDYGRGAGMMDMNDVLKDLPDNLQTGRIPELAQAFVASARLYKKDWTPRECAEKFAAAIAPYGLTLHSLTDGECTRLVDAVMGGHHTKASFPALLEKLRTASEPPRMPTRRFH